MKGGKKYFNHFEKLSIHFPMLTENDGMVKINRIWRKEYNLSPDSSLPTCGTPKSTSPDFSLLICKTRFHRVL